MHIKASHKVVKMRKKLTHILTALFVIVAFGAHADISVEGNYQGKNLYIQNPESDDGFGFCATRVTVNGNPISDGINSSAFEIDFAKLGVKKGEDVVVVIEHGIGCKPKILNPEVLKPKSTFEIQSINASPDGLLKWTATNEQGKLPYVVEQYRWNKWVALGEVDGVGTPEAHSYEFKVSPHSGENKLRVVQTDHTGKKKPSKAVTFTSNLKEPSMSPIKVRNDVVFAVDGSPIETKYEIYDAYGNIVKKGVGTQVDCSNLKKGAYYINYDNKNEKFLKK